MEIWEPKPRGTLWATPGLLWDPVTFTFTFTYIHTHMQGRIQVSISNNIFLETLVAAIMTLKRTDEESALHFTISL